MSIYIDLHMHSEASVDGEIPAVNLVKQCKEKGIRIMAVADHNVVSEVEKALYAAREAGITCIPAAEYDGMYKGLDFHIVGYGIDHTNPLAAKAGLDLWQQCLDNNDVLIELTKKHLGFEVTKEELDPYAVKGMYTGLTFAEALLKNPKYDDCEFLKPYRPGGARSESPYLMFYWDYYMEGKPCQVSINYPPIEEVIAMIKECGGVPVAAHLGYYMQFVSMEEFEQIFEELIALGIEGVEAFSSYHSEEQNAYFLKKTREKNLLVTCGSDYHGKTKPAIELGGIKCTIDQSEIEAQLKEYGLI